MNDPAERLYFGRTVDEPEIIHPFVGFVLNPASTDESWRPLGVTKPPINSMGFEGPEFALPSPPGTFNIWMTGGSVAKELADAEHATFIDTPKRAGISRAAVFHCVALQGFKQPQQLLTLTYLAALGAKLDCVINMDGINDVSLHLAENAADGVCVSFPRSWMLRSKTVLSKRALGLVGEAAAAERLASRVSRWRAVPSTIANRIVDRLRGFSEQRLRAAAQASAAARAPLNSGMFGHGADALADLWFHSSLATHKLVTSYGGTYIHVLQPNVYDEGAKVLCEEELRDAFNPDHPYRPGVVAGYPLVRQRGEMLRAAGVNFLDFTSIFRTERGQMYIDTCGHFMPAGNRLVGQALADAVHGALAATR